MECINLDSVGKEGGRASDESVYEANELFTSPDFTQPRDPFSVG